MSFTSKQIEGFVPSGEINENSIAADKSLGSDVSKIFEKQKKLRESLALLIQTCYEEIHEAADKRQKKIIEFNDKYLIQTILENVSTIDTKAIEDKIEELIIEKYVSLKVLDQAKLKGYVWKILNQGYEEYHKNDGSQEIVTEDKSQKSNQQTSIDIFKDTLSNENLMNGLLDRLGGRIIDSQGKFNDSLLEELGKLDVNSISNSNITKQVSPISNPKTVTEKLSRAQRRRIKREKRAEKRLLKKQSKQLNIQQGISDVIQSQMSQMEQLNNSLSSIGFGTTKKKKRFGFFRQRIRNIKAVGKRGKRKLTLIGRKFGMFKPKKVEQKSDKKKFLEMYNKMALKRLYSRIDEFDKGQIMNKNNKSKKRLIVSFGLLIGTVVKNIVKTIWNLGKFVFKSLWKVSKKIFGLVKIGFQAIIAKLKWFIMTPAGAYITGFVAGLIWHGLIKPVIEWGKQIYHKVLDFLGIDSIDSLEDVMAEKEKMFKYMRTEFSNFIAEHGGSIHHTEQVLGSLDHISSMLVEFECQAETFGQDLGGSVLNGGISTIGILVGSFFGPIGSAIGGGIGKFIGMTAEYFYKHTPDDQVDTNKKDIIAEKMRKRYAERENSVNPYKQTLINLRTQNNDLENKIKTINGKLEQKELSEEEKDNLRFEKNKYEEQLTKNQQLEKDILDFYEPYDDSRNSGIRSKIDEIYKTLSKNKNVNYFNVIGDNRFNFQSEMTQPLKQTIVGDDRLKMLFKVKKFAFFKAYNMLINNKIKSSDFQNVAEGILNTTLDTKRTKGATWDMHRLGQKEYTLRQYISKIRYKNGDYQAAFDYDIDTHEAFDDAEESERYSETIDMDKVKLLTELIRERLSHSKYFFWKVGNDSRQIKLNANIIDSMINSSYAQQRIKLKIMQGIDPLKLTTNDDVIKGIIKDIGEKYCRVSNIKFEPYTPGTDTSQNDDKNLNWLTGSIGLFGKFVFSTEKDPIKRQALIDSMYVSMQRMDVVTKENAEIAKKKGDKAIKAKEYIQRGIIEDIKRLKKEKEYLEKLPTPPTAALIGESEQDIETNPNADADGSSSKFGNEKK